MYVKQIKLNSATGSRRGSISFSLSIDDLTVHYKNGMMPQQEPIDIYIDSLTAILFIIATFILGTLANETHFVLINYVEMRAASYTRTHTIQFIELQQYFFHTGQRFLLSLSKSAITVFPLARITIDQFVWFLCFSE